MGRPYLLNTNIVVNQKTLEFFTSRVHCRNCGKCCSGRFFKWLHLHEGEGPRFAREMGLELKEFYEKHCGQENYQTYLKFPCPFLEQKAAAANCKVYEKRGIGCRMFPLAKLGNRKMETIAIDLRCPAGAELAEEFRKEALARKQRFHKN